MKLRQTVFVPFSRRLVAKIRGLFVHGNAEDELSREVSAHLAMLEEEFQRRGMSAEDARFAARRAYGGVEQAKELHRDERSVLWVEQALQDLRHAFRSLRKSPAFVSVALLSLAFGIGVNTSIFTLVNGILIKTLPVPDPHRIVQLSAHIDKVDSNGFSFPVYRELRRQDTIFSDAIAFSNGSAKLDLGGEPAKITYKLVTGNYFSFLGARPFLGRLLDEEDDRAEGGHRVCVLSYQTWKSRFGGDPNVLSRGIRLNGVPFEIAGVAAADFIGAELQRRDDLWAPTAVVADLEQHPRESANYVWIHALARLRPGLSFVEARDRLAAASHSIESALPKDRANTGALYQIRDAGKGFDNWRTELHDPLLVLMGAVTLVLLVACANLANLLLARTSERHQEFAIKLSLGISRWRLLRQLMLETFLIAFGGGAAALLLSAGLTEFLLNLFNASQLYNPLSVTPDRMVLWFTFAACVLTAFVAGLYPAWQASRIDATPGLKGAALWSLSQGTFRRALILLQVTLAVVLLFGASLFTHSLRQLYVTNLGYEIDRVLTFQLQERRAASMSDGASASSPALAELLARVRQLPDVESAACSNPGVLGRISMSDDVTSRENVRRVEEVAVLLVSPAYFSTMRIPLYRGREFQASDWKGAPLVAVVNQQLASMLSPSRDALGLHINAWGEKNSEIIGVAGDSKYNKVRETARPIVYLAFDQTHPGNCAMEVRSRGGTAAAERQVRELIKSGATGFEAGSATSLTYQRDILIAQDRFLTFLSTLFGVLGTALALVGIYGLISYSVTRRTREIGIRMSIGAQRSDVLWLFVREATLLVSGGILIGMPLALALARFLGAMLFEVSTSDPFGIASTLVLLAIGALAAALLPARRATRVNPVQALRYD